MIKNMLLLIVCIYFSSLGIASAEQSNVDMLKDTVVKELGIRKSLNSYYFHMDRSMSGLNFYKQKILRIQENVGNSDLKTLFSTITLSQPIPMQEVFAVIEEYGLKPKLVYVFAEPADPSEGLITLGVYFKKENSEETINNILNTFTKRKNAKVIGAVSLIGQINNTELHRLQNDTRIFLVDISYIK